jgi:O-methyltransferase
MFNQSDDDGHMKLAAHSEELYDTVCQRFADLDNVHVTKGRVPEILHEVAPETISFMHIDLNAAEPELGALKLLFERLSPGGVLVLDDYGWLASWEQKAAEDPFFESLGYQVLELPTGQGLIIK